MKSIIASTVLPDAKPPIAATDSTVRCAEQPQSPVNLSVIGVLKTSNAAREERLVDLLANPAVVGTRRSPGFRPGDPRLPALAIALLQMPATFRTRDAAPVVAGLLGRPTHDYRLNHFRYDLGKLRARGLAERVGVTRRYHLTRIGRIVCRVLEKGRVVKDLIESRARNVARSAPLVRSA